MKSILICFACAAGLTSGAVLADNPNWSDEKKLQILTNRCSDAGKGNGVEDVINNTCGDFKNDSWFDAEWYAEQEEDLVIDEFLDVDPGNSQDNNANN